MKGVERRQQGKNAFDLIEEATHLLRTAPAATLAVYYAGAIPFVLGLLYFWADMSRSPYAPQHLAESALAMTLLFLWMKFCQTVFSLRIRAQLAATSMPALNFCRCLKIFLAQAVIQPTALFVLPLALFFIVPFGWMYAFYQNATALCDGEEKNTGLGKKAWAQARLWPRQNHWMLGIMLIFGFAVFLNWISAGFMLPQLLKMLFGVETQFSMSSRAMLNTTFFAAMCCLTYLCVDPVMKIIYVLRCFYGESLHSGEDLKAELKPLSVSVRPLAALLVICLVFTFGSPVRSAAADAAPSSAVPAAGKAGISPADLDRVINQTIHESKYTWRMPREKSVQAEPDGNIVTRFFDGLGAMFRKWAKAIGDWLEWLLRKLFSHRPTYHASEGSGYGWILSQQMLLYGLVAVVLIALAIFVMRTWRGRRRPGAVTITQAIQPVPDITDENVRADQLPEDGWLTLARELLERGELRLAMRAFYLASLAHLAARNLINLTRFKSNRDYERELRRRAHSFPDLLSIFGNNLLAFESIWYGSHEVDRGGVESFAANVERIRSNA